jgi:hypothetical protein
VTRAGSLQASIQPVVGEGIMTLRSTQLGFAALVLAMATVPLAGAPARAFTIETQSATNPDGSARFADPDDQVKNFSNGPSGLSFQVGPGQGLGLGSRFSPMSGFQGGANAVPPDPYGPRSLGNN